MLVAGLALALGVGVIALYATLPDVRPLAKAPPATTAFIELRREQARETGKRFVLRQTWRPVDRISPYLQESVVLSEDAKFWKHEGVDWDAVEKAAEKNWKKGKVAVGGSTITQQLAKNLYLSPSKNPLRKLRELLIARRLEAELSKERLLELYLNVAEWGDGVFGAEAASRRWFGVSAAELNPVQAARLAVALPNPRLRAPSARDGALDRKAARLVTALHRRGLLDAAALDQALVQLGQPRPTGTTAPVAGAAPEAAPPLFVEDPATGVPRAIPIETPVATEPAADPAAPATEEPTGDDDVSAETPVGQAPGP
jgi:monofunctional biosynthetic peptidoglycan transglycosylase